MASISKQKKDTKFKPYHVQFAEQVISMLEAGTAPWQSRGKAGNCTRLITTPTERDTGGLTGSCSRG